jgi:hypothetical protein
LFGVVAALFLLCFGNQNLERLTSAPHVDDMDRHAGHAVEYGGDESFVDDDDYVEYTITWDEPEPVWTEPEPVRMVDYEGDTEPMRSRAEHLLHAPAETWHTAPVESWHSVLEPEPEPEPAPPEPPEPRRDQWRGILDELLGDPPAKPVVEPIGYAHNGFHVDVEQRFQSVPPARHEQQRGDNERPARHEKSEHQPEPRQFWFESNGRHSRDDPDDASSYGRHSAPGRD